MREFGVAIFGIRQGSVCGPATLIRLRPIADVQLAVINVLYGVPCIKCIDSSQVY